MFFDFVTTAVNLERLTIRHASTRCQEHKKPTVMLDISFASAVSDKPLTAHLFEVLGEYSASLAASLSGIPKQDVSVDIDGYKEMQQQQFFQNIRQKAAQCLLSNRDQYVTVHTDREIHKIFEYIQEFFPAVAFQLLPGADDGQRVCRFRNPNRLK